MIQSASSAREIIDRIVKQSGITKKLAAEILHTIPGIIEDGLKKDGEVRVKGLGTFRLQWTRGKMGRNLKTGERVEIPSHNRVVFHPEQSFKDYINRDNRLLSYKIIPSAEQVQDQKIIEQYQYQEQYQNQSQYQSQLQPESEAEPETETEPEYLPEPEPEPENVIEPKIETETETEFEPEPSTRKRRIHWIVPVAIGVIIVLSLLFYFRNFHTSPKSAAERSDVPTQSGSAVSSQPVVEPTHNSELKTPSSALSTQNSELISEGTRLFKLAREIYGNPYLWVLIYKENLDKISDPDMVVSGRELIIPVLEGKPERLTRNDSLAISEGYRLVYEFYQVKEETKARDFARAMNRYKPN